MKKVVEVKDIKIGEGMPKICVPIVGKSEEEILEEATYLKEIRPDIVEWRADFYENIEIIEKVRHVLGNLRKCLPEIPILFTFRSEKEGGEKTLSVDYYAQLNKQIVETQLVDLVDVELFTGDNVVREIVDFAHNHKVKVIISNHDFHKTPPKEEIIYRLRKMQRLGADLPKIAVMPKNQKDVLVLLAATNDMVQDYARGPISTMSMARFGVVSRLSGEVFGSALTFGAAKKVSAPGQIPAVDLRKIIQILHSNI